MTKEECYILEPATKANAVIIWLHGLGADGRDFIDVVGQLGLPEQHGVRFIFPNAPFMPISINNGYVMRGWYDIYDLQSMEREDEQGIVNAQKIIAELIAEQVAQGIKSERIILVGFSQGGAIGLYTGLRCKYKLGGIIALSAYMPLAKNFYPQEFKLNHKTPIFIAHGIYDKVVSYTMGQAACTQLQKANYHVEWNTYPIAHSIDLNEIHSIGSFIRRCLDVNPEKSRTNIVASTHQGVQLVPISDIYYFQAEHKYVIAYHKQGQLLIDDSLDKLEREFGDSFIRVHRKNLVAKDKIMQLLKDEMGNYFVKLQDGYAPIQVSRRKLPQVRQFLLC